MMPPTSIDGTDITGATIDGTNVQEITVDGQTVFTAGQPGPINSGLDHLFNAKTTPTANPWVDELGSKDAIIDIGSPSLTGSINGFTAMNYTGSDDHKGTSALNTGPNAEHTFVAVCEPDNLSGFYTLFNNGLGPSTDGYRYRFDPFNGFGFVSNGKSAVAGSSPTTNPQVWVATYDGSNLIIDVNGIEEVNTGVTTPNTPTSEFDIGEQGDNNNRFKGDIGAIGHESGAANASRRDELTEILGNEFNIPVSV